MKIGASISGGAHVVLIGLAIFAGELFTDGQANPVPIAEVELMTGAEFEAAQSVAPNFDPDLPSAPKAPEPRETRADVQVADENAAPERANIAEEPDAPRQGDDVAPLERAPTPDVAVAEIGEQPSAPPAPEGDLLITAPPTADGSARVATVASIPTPAPRPVRPSIDTSAPDSTPTPPPPPDPDIAPVPEPTEAPEIVERVEPPKPPEPAPAPEIARVEPAPEITPDPVEAPEDKPEPTPEPEPEITKLNDPDETAPSLAPAPPRKPKDVADAKKAQRLAQEAEAAKTGATEQADASQGGGTSRTVGDISFRDKDALRLGIKGNFNPPQGAANATQLAVVVRIRLGIDGKIIGKPEVRSPRSPNGAEKALARAGILALLKSNAKGVFKRLPKDKHEKWRLIDVTFTPKEIQFL